MDNIVDRFYHEEVYTLADLRDLFTAIHEGKIKTVVIENMGNSLVFDISTIVRCKDCRFGVKRLDALRNECIECHKYTSWHTYNLDHFCSDGKRKECE